MPENALGAYHKILHKIDLETDDKDVKVHEVAHSSRPRAQEAKINQLKATRKFLKDGVVPNDYLDSNNEIYARNIFFKFKVINLMCYCKVLSSSSSITIYENKFI